MDRGRMRWNGWGWTNKDFGLGDRAEAVWAWIARELGLSSLPSTPAVSLEAVTFPPVRLGREALAALRSAVGAENVRDDDRDRVFHALGRSYHDLVRLRTGRLPCAPDAVVYPGDADEVEAVLRLAVTHAFSVVPYGGGSSVVGGVEADDPRGRPVVTLDTTRLAVVGKVDPEDRTVALGAGLYGPELETALAEQGYTLGHFPQSFEFSTLGGWIAARGAGQMSNRYGKAEEWLVGAELATAHGRLRTGGFPATAAGPDLDGLVAGSEGTLGVITEATVRVHPTPATRDYRAWLLPSFGAGQAVVRELAQEEAPVAMVRISDPDETRFLRGLSGAGKTPRLAERAVAAWMRRRGHGEGTCLLLVGAEGDRGEVNEAMRLSRKAARSHGGFPLGSSLGRHWHRDRFRLPYLRDPLLDRGLGVDTLETAVPWSRAAAMHAAVTRALRSAMDAGAPAGHGISMCHLSHTYPEGTSLYFTCVWPRDDRDPVGQWKAIKAAASDAIVQNGGTISHHHGVGLDHLPWMEREKGAAGMALLRGAKAAVDPEGVLNPGKLVGPPR